MHLAGDAHHRHAVRPVGGDVDVQDCLLEKVFESLTDRRVWFEDIDAVLVGRDVELVAGADHALGGDAAEVSGAHLTRGQPAARRDVRDNVADRQIRGAGHHRDISPAKVDVGHVQRLATGMGCQLEDAANGHPLPGTANLLGVLDLEAGHGQALAQLRQRHVELHQFVQPAQRHFHTNCSRKRSSLA
jgi:hypothetical protein